MAERALFLAAVFAGPGAIVYLQLRHGFLTALVVLIPAVLAGLSFLFPAFFAANAAAAMLFAAAAGLMLGDVALRGICDGAAPRDAISAATGFVAGPLLPLLAACLLTMAAFGYLSSYWTLAIRAGASLLTGFALALACGRLVSLFPYTEEFIARANVAREWRERALERFSSAAEPRWAFSIMGIASVLATIAAFGVRDAQPIWDAQAPLGLAAGTVLSAAGFAAIAREWRLALAATLATLFMGLLLLWAHLRRSPVADFLTMAASLMVAMAPLGVFVARVRRNTGEGDDVASALLRAIRKEGPSAIVLGAILSGFGLWVSAVSGLLSPGLVYGIALPFATLLLFPALTIVLHTLLPRYRSVDEVFGKR